MSSLAHGKQETGKGEKPSDKWAVPLCAEHHLNGAASVHNMAEEQFWAAVGRDPFAIAKAFYAEFLMNRPTQGKPKKRVRHQPDRKAKRRRHKWPRGRKLRSRNTLRKRR